MSDCWVSDDSWSAIGFTGPHWCKITHNILVILGTQHIKHDPVRFLAGKCLMKNTMWHIQDPAYASPQEPTSNTGPTSHWAHLCYKHWRTKYRIWYQTRGSTEWKKCQYIGSLVDTEADFYRKTVAFEAEVKLKYIWKTKTPTHINLKTFNKCSCSAFLYNCGL